LWALGTQGNVIRVQKCVGVLCAGVCVLYICMHVYGKDLMEMCVCMHFGKTYILTLDAAAQP